MARLEDHGKFFRLPPDNRDLDYEKYFDEGKEIHDLQKEYTSHNTRRLKVEEIKQLLFDLELIKKHLR